MWLRVGLARDIHVFAVYAGTDITRVVVADDDDDYEQWLSFNFLVEEKGFRIRPLWDLINHAIFTLLLARRLR